MTIRNRVNSIVDNIDLGKPVYEVTLSEKRIKASLPHFNMNIDGEDFVSRCVERWMSRDYVSSENKFEINKEEIIEKTERQVHRNIIDLFIACSPYAKPRRTAIFKKFYYVVDENNNNEEFKKSIFDIYEYFYNNTRTESITHSSNDAHRTNIYQLLCLMERKYGKQK